MQNNLVRGQLVRRLADPVHTGRVTLVSNSALAEASVSILWLSKPPIAEHRVPVATLEPAEDWK